MATVLGYGVGNTNGVRDFSGRGSDVTAPVLGTPEPAELAVFSTQVSCTTDSAGEGTGYVVITTSATSPSVAQIQAGQDHLGASAVASASVVNPSASFANIGTLYGLTSNTSYYLHCQHQDGAGNDSTVVTSAQFTTTDASPTGAASSTTTANGSCVVDWNLGTLYWVVTQSASQPSIAQVQAGQNHLGLAADDSGSLTPTGAGAESVAASGLTASTTYYFHFQYEGADTSDSPVVSSTSFATPATDASGQDGSTIGSGLRGPFGF